MGSSTLPHGPVVADNRQPCCPRRFTPGCCKFHLSRYGTAAGTVRDSFVQTAWRDTPGAQRQQAALRPADIAPKWLGTVRAVSSPRTTEN